MMFAVIIKHLLQDIDEVKLDLHTHSKYSFDSAVGIQEIVQAAKFRGLNGFALTDHNTNEGVEEAVKFSTPDFFIIPGVEIRTTWGDIIGLFCTKFIESRDPVSVADEIHRQGGLVIWPHPIRTNYEAPSLLLEKFDAVETFNARNTDGPALTQSRGEAKLLELAEKYRLAIVAGSDAHTFAEVGNGRTILPDCSSLEEIKAAIKDGKAMVEGEKTSFWSVFGSKLSSRFRRKHAQSDGVEHD